MKTCIYQSYRTVNVPPWIAACMSSVRRWAAHHGFAYAFYDDAFFDRVPADLRPFMKGNKCLLADYARVVVARELLSSGQYDRVIWVDADALVFNPEKFEIPVQNGYAFCREVWLERVVLGRPHFKLAVNNAVSVFCRDERIIDFYLDSARRILTTARTINALTIGSTFLLELRRALPVPLLASVGLFSPELAAHYLRDDAKFLRPYLKYQTSPVHAVNLCLSKNGIPTATIENVINRLLADAGASLNRHYATPYRAPAQTDEYKHPTTSFLALRDTYHALKRTLFLMRNAEFGMRNEIPPTPPRPPSPPANHEAVSAARARP